MSGGARDVSVVIVSWNVKEPLRECLSSVARFGERVLETIVVDNASSDGSAEWVRGRFPSVTWLQNTANEGFARACNRGLREAHGAYALVLNPDTVLRPGAVATMAATLDARAQAAVVGPRTSFPDGSVQVSFGPRLHFRSEWRQRRLVRGVRRRAAWAVREAEALASREHEPDWVSGACMMLRLEAVRAVGLFDESFFLYEEDVDLCVRLRAAGHRVLFLPNAQIEHRLGASMAQSGPRPRVEYHRSHVRYYAKHNGAAATIVLRGLILARASLGWVLAALSGRSEDRRGWAAALRASVLGAAS